MNAPVNILLADDDFDDRLIFNEALATSGYVAEVKEASNGQQAIDLLNEDQPLPDFVIMDINMPNVNGIDCLKWIRSEERLKSLPVIMLTTSSSQEMIRASRAAGADLYFEKPTEFKDLCKLVGDLAQRNWHALSNTPPNILGVTGSSLLSV